MYTWLRLLIFNYKWSSTRYERDDERETKKKRKSGKHIPCWKFLPLTLPDMAFNKHLIKSWTRTRMYRQKLCDKATAAAGRKKCIQFSGETRGVTLHKCSRLEKTLMPSVIDCRVSLMLSPPPHQHLLRQMVEYFI